MDLIRKCLEAAGLSKALGVVDHKEFLRAVDEAGVYDALANGSFHLFLKSLFHPGLLPATFQKLHDFGWSDEGISKLFSGHLLKEAPTTLINAINMGALSLEEHNEYANVPNQEIEIIFYSDEAGQFLAWIQENMTVPKISQDAFASS